MREKRKCILWVSEFLLVSTIRRRRSEVWTVRCIRSSGREESGLVWGIWVRRVVELWLVLPGGIVMVEVEVEVRVRFRARVRVRFWLGAKPMLCWSSKWRLPRNLRSVIYFLAFFGWYLRIYLSFNCQVFLGKQSEGYWFFKLLFWVFRTMKKLRGYGTRWNYSKMKNRFCGYVGWWRRQLLRRGLR